MAGIEAVPLFSKAELVTVSGKSVIDSYELPPDAPAHGYLDSTD